MAWANLVGMMDVSARNAFGTSITYTPSGGDAQSIAAILDRAAERVQAEGEVAFTVLQPKLHVRYADLSTTPRKGDTVTVSGSIYVVTDVVQTTEGTAADCWLMEAS